jgi:hypothetical protein
MMKAKARMGSSGHVSAPRNSSTVRWFEVARCGAIALALMAAEAAFAKSYILVAGRRDPRIYAIDFEAALRPENNNTPNAIVSRSLVGPRRLDGTLLGDPANIVLSADQRTAYVMNHHVPIRSQNFLHFPRVS